MLGRAGTLLVSALFASLAIGLAAPSVAQPRDPANRAVRAARLRAMGQAFLASGDPGSAIGYLRDAIQADAHDAESYRILGTIYLDRGSPNDALEVYAVGLRYRPDHPPLWRALARAFEVEGDLPRAAEALRELVARAPADVEAHLARAELARQRQAWFEALGAYRAVIDLAAQGAELDDARLEGARRYAAALRIYTRETDPVTGQDRCESESAVRRALAGCR